MDTQQAVVVEELKAEWVQEPTADAAARAAEPLPHTGMQLRLKAERVQEPASFADGPNVSYIYELAVSHPQPVTVDLPLVVITFHGPSACNGGNDTLPVPAMAGRRG